MEETIKTTKWQKFVLFFKNIWTVIVNIFKWAATVLEDQGTAGSVSSKRVTLFVALYIFFKLKEQATTTGATIDTYYLWGDLSLILVCLGVITSEFFAAFGQNGFNKQK